MTTVPHPVPSRTAHAIAALYGHDDDTLVAWQRACAEAAEALRPQPDEDRLRKALTLAQDGHVTLEDDGFATVENRGKHYEVQADGACECPDAQHRGATCKHTLAVQIHYLASAGLRPGGDHRQAPTAVPSTRASQPSARPSAVWDVREAPASACFKWRVGSVELLYTLRGVDDAELLQRMAATLPQLHALLDACEARAAQRAAAPAATAPSQPPPSEPPPAALPQPDMPALLQAALQQVLATAQARTSAHSNGTAPSASSPDDQQTGICSLHQAEMTRHTDPATGDTWFSHYDDEQERYCKGARPTRRPGKSRR